MSKIWFTADTHFGHQRTLELSKRLYSNVEEMNWDMVKKWNSVVDEEDTVYHLGDFGDLEFAKLLNGNIILLFGNYEWDEFKRYYELSIDEYIENLKDGWYFEEVYAEHEIVMEFSNNEYSLVHEPSNANPHRFKLFGHIHKLQMVKRNGLNVGVDCHDFYPIDLETVEFYRNAIERHYDEDVFGE